MRINSLALVIAEPIVKRTYPGGIQGFLGDQVRIRGHQQRLEQDGQLVAVSDDDPDRIVAAYARIRGLTGQSADNGALCVLVDPVKGAVAPCDWLTCSRSADGSMTLNYAGTAADPQTSIPFGDATESQPTVADGERTTPPITAAGSTSVPAPSAHNLMKLAEANGTITWLDVDTGRQLTSDSLPPAAQRYDSAAALEPMLTAITTMAEARGWEFERNEEDRCVAWRLNAGPLLLLPIRFYTSRQDNAVILSIRLPGQVTEDRLDSVTQYLAGANWGLEVGAFHIDRSDGEIAYCAGIPAPEGLLSPAAAEIALDRSMGTVAKYAAGIIEVSRGADPVEVLARIEK